MKKYLLLIEDEAIWARFKESIQKDINSEILELIEKKVKKENKKCLIIFLLIMVENRQKPQKRVLD